MGLRKIVPSIGLLFLMISNSLAVDREDSLAYDSMVNLAFKSFALDIDKSRALAEEILRNYEWPEAVGNALCIKGIAFQITNELDSASHYLIKSQGYLCEDGRNPLECTKINTQLGTLMIQQGNYSAASNFLKSSLSTAMELNDSFWVAYISKELAKTSFYLKDYESAIELARESMEYFTSKSKNHRNRIELLNILGNSLMEKDDSSALAIINEAYLISKELNDTALMIVSFTNLGTYEHKTGYSRKALEHFFDAHQLIKKTFRQQNNRGPLEINIGIAYGKLEIWDSAKHFLNTGLSHCLPDGHKNYKINAFEELALIHGKEGNVTDSLRAMLEASSYEISLLQDQRENALDHLRFEFDLEKKELENLKLRKNNDFQARMIRHRNYLIYGMLFLMAVVIVLLIFLVRINRRLLKASKELKVKQDILENLNEKKDQMISIISHDLRAPINQIIYLHSTLQANNMELEQKADLSKTILENTKSGLSMLNSMLEWTKNYLNDQLETEEVELPLLIENLKSDLELKIQEKKLTFQTSFQFEKVTTDKNILEIVLRNLFTNAIKFSPEGGEIFVKSEIQGEHKLISVIDEGVGMPDKLKRVINEKSNERVVPTKGTFNERGTGLGLMLSQDFAEKIGGELRVGEGTDQGAIMQLWL